MRTPDRVWRAGRAGVVVPGPLVPNLHRVTGPHQVTANRLGHVVHAALLVDLAVTDNAAVVVDFDAHKYRPGAFAHGPGWVVGYAVACDRTLTAVVSIRSPSTRMKAIKPTW